MPSWLKKLAWPIVAVIGMISVFLGRKKKDDNASVRAEMDEAVLGEIAERRRRKEAEADAELEKERSLSSSAQYDAVMERLRKRRAKRDGG